MGLLRRMRVGESSKVSIERAFTPQFIHRGMVSQKGGGGNGRGKILQRDIGLKWFQWGKVYGHERCSVAHAESVGLLQQIPEAIA